jgi:hypothetical protein
MRTLLLSLSLAASVFVSADASACSCLPPDVTASYNTSGHAIFGRVLGRTVYPMWHVYDVEIVKDFRDGRPAGDVVQIVTSSSQASCGDSFQIGQRYLLFADDQAIGGAQRWVTTYCRANTPLAQVSPDDRYFLRSREIVDPNGVYTCADPNIPLVNCLIDPCQMAPACPGATCYANYCGGCNAEFYDSFGYEACTTP